MNRAAIAPSLSFADVIQALLVNLCWLVVIEMVVAEEWAPLKKLSQATPTGAARVLRTQFHLVLTERSGMGISWDEEQPPLYEDVPASPPTYITDYDGPPLHDHEHEDLHLGS